MKRLISLALLLASSMCARAGDEWWVGIKCNTATDRLIIYYFAPAPLDEQGSMPKKKGINEWSVADLISVVDGQYELSGIARTCKLSHGLYAVSIEPDPDNLDMSGECGAAVSFVIDIRRGATSILTRHRLDSSRCNIAGGKTTTRIVIDGKSPQPKLTERPVDGA
jgi:hypothetical protein